MSIENVLKNLPELEDKEFPIFFDISPITEETMEKKENPSRNLKEQLIPQCFANGERICNLPILSNGSNFILPENTQNNNPKTYKQNISKRNVTIDPKIEKQKNQNIPKNTRKNRYTANYYQHFYKNIYNDDSEQPKRELSIDITPLGKPLHDFSSQFLQSLKVTPPKHTEIGWKGLLFNINKSVEKVNPRNTLNLPPPSPRDLEAHSKNSIVNDEFVKESIDQNSANIFITDLLLSTLMVSTQSSIGWDLLVEKHKKTLIFYRRNASEIDKELLNDNRHNNNEENRQKIDEATRAFQSLMAVAVDRSKGSFKSPKGSFQRSIKDQIGKALNPLRYRLYELSPAMKVLVRSQIHAVSQKRPIRFCALSEGQSVSAAGGWRPKLEIQKGSVLTDQIKLKSFAVARSTVQASLAGCDDVHFGFVSQRNAMKPERHVLQSWMKESLGNLIRQLGLSSSNMWGVFQKLCETLLNECPDDKFSIVKDPNNNCLLIFRAEK